MKLDSVNADLDFMGNTITSLTVSNQISVLADAKCNFGLDLEITECNHREGRMEGCLELTLHVDVVSKDTAHKTEIDLVMMGAFSSALLEEEDFLSMLYVNGGSTLYSLARAFVISFSSQIFLSGKVILPLINMVEFIKEKQGWESRASDSTPIEP